MISIDVPCRVTCAYAHVYLENLINFYQMELFKVYLMGHALQYQYFHFQHSFMVEFICMIFFVLGKFIKMKMSTVELNLDLPSLYMGSLEASGDLCSTILPRDGCNCGIFMAACWCPCPCPCIVGDIPFQIRWFHVWGRFCVSRQPHKELITRTAAHTALLHNMRFVLCIYLRAKLLLFTTIQQPENERLYVFL